MTPEQEGKLLSDIGALVRGQDRQNHNADLLRHEVRLLRDEQRTNHAQVTGRLDKHGKRIKALEDKMNHPADDRDVTGNYHVDFALIQAEHQRIAEAERLRRSESIFAKRQTKVWIVGAFGALAMMALSAVGTIIFWLLTHGK